MTNFWSNQVILQKIKKDMWLNGYPFRTIYDIDFYINHFSVEGK